MSLTDPKDAIILTLTTIIILPFASWAAKQLWSKFTGEQTSLAKLIQETALDMRKGFQEVRDMINSHRLDLRELSVRVTHLEADLEKLEDRQSAHENAAQAMERRLNKQIDEKQDKP